MGNRKNQTTILKHHKDPSSKSLPTKSANLIGDEQESLIQGRKRRSNRLRGSESVRIGMSNGTEQTRKRAAPGDSNWLPPGWRVEDKVRTSGATAGSVDKVCISLLLRFVAITFTHCYSVFVDKKDLAFTYV